MVETLTDPAVRVQRAGDARRMARTPSRSPRTTRTARPAQRRSRSTSARRARARPTARTRPTRASAGAACRALASPAASARRALRTRIAAIRTARATARTCTARPRAPRVSARTASAACRRWTARRRAMCWPGYSEGGGGCNCQPRGGADHVRAGVRGAAACRAVSGSEARARSIVGRERGCVGGADPSPNRRRSGSARNPAPVARRVVADHLPASLRRAAASCTTG